MYAVLHSILVFPTIESMGETSEAMKYGFLFEWFKYPLLGVSYILDRLSDYWKQQLVTLVFKYGGHRDVPECVITSATNLMHPNCLRALIHMSLIEFNSCRYHDIIYNGNQLRTDRTQAANRVNHRFLYGHSWGSGQCWPMNTIWFYALNNKGLRRERVNELNREAIDRNEEKLSLFYGKRDQWCPQDYCHRIQHLYPNCDIRLCLDDMNHAFVMNRESTEMTPAAAMCSDEVTGWKPTNGICIDNKVPKQYT
ncbi:unnamed protein product [Medioppia subpectinata]|uniref:Uncharacterized protein n=1 Tax=Medioppia subpectinata TaxID=1979941 RepID=A0A7R9Q1J3_9ACAR|nr:unnamed protein product [Medioppia subpectinata]CAG2109275.1 unnamed protein product [Medioppia subpectinata]